MDGNVRERPESWLTSTQIGAVGEAVIASGLILGSRGRLAPFKPLADDGGIDLLIYDKVTHRALPVQVKCRTARDKTEAGTVQFDVRRKTFAKAGGGFVVCALLDGAQLLVAWVIPSDVLETLRRPRNEKFVIAPSSKAISRDCYRPYRKANMDEVVQTLIEALARGPGP